MPASKQVGLGTIVKTDQAVANTFVAQTLVVSATPVGRERTEVDAGGLGDTIDVPELGVEARSKFTFTQFWHPGDTEHEKLDTAFGTNQAFNVQLVTSHSTPKTQQFGVRITKLSPEEVTRDGLYKRSVEMVRTGAITLT